MDFSSFLNPKMHKKIGLLPPEALKYLLKQIDNMPDDQPEKKKMRVIADIAAKTLEKKTEPAEMRRYNIQRYFYLPFSKMLFDGVLDRRESGRISRDSMAYIWEYMRLKLMPDEVEELEQSFSQAVRDKEMKKAKIIVGEFNRLAGQKLQEVIDKCKDNDKEWARFAMVIGNKLVARDAEELSYYLQNGSEIEKAVKLFPDEIEDLSGAALSKITNEIVKVKETMPRLLPVYASMLITALKHPAHVLRLIQKYYRIDDASAAAKCDLAVLGEILLFNAKIAAHNFVESKKNQNSREKYLNYYRDYADVVLGIEREFDVSSISSWGKEIIGLKEQVSEALEKDILACPRQLKTILGRYQQIVDSIAAKEPTEAEITELNRCVYLLHGVKNYIAATSCNTIYQENYAKCVQFIEVFSVGVVEQIRRDTQSNKKAFLIYLEISTDLLKIIKSEEEAELYHKGSLLAIKGNEQEQEA